MTNQRKLQDKLHQKIISNIAEIITEIGKDKIAFVILFGSFAKGNWVYDIYQENGAYYEYASDYDFLVITKRNHFKQNYELVDKIKKEIGRKYLDRVHPTTIIIEPLKYVNSQIEKSHYFFLDIKKEGKILFASDGFKLSTPKQLNEKEKRKTAAEDYEQWMSNGNSFLRDSRNAAAFNDYKISAFYLHQAAESLYSCALLVMIGYKPKTHNLEELGKLCTSQNNKFLTIFPQNNKSKPGKHRLTPKSYLEFMYVSDNENDWFELLKIAYIEARYNRNYKIRKEQLEYLTKKVERLRKVVEMVCGLVLKEVWPKEKLE
jgi:HEPN domain-containing protein/predicted nucleotidyltransferase